MAYDSLWYDDQQLAGPSSEHTPLSPDALQVPYRIGLPDHPQASPHLQPDFCTPYPKTLESETDSSDQYIIRGHFPLPDWDAEVVGEMFQYHDPGFRPGAYSSHQSSSSFLIDSPSNSSIEGSDTVMSNGQTLFSKDHESHILFHHDPRAIWSSLYRQQDTSSSSQSCSSLASLNTSKPPESLQIVVTPKLEETDTHALVPQTLSPYAPMPLPPIFLLESRSKLTHIPVDSTSSLRPFWHVKSDKSCPVDPVLVQQPPIEPDFAPSPEDVPFTRGSTATGCLWSPPLSLEFPPPAKHDLSLNCVADIPLAIAKRLAWECRTAGPNTKLPLPFLMLFMGQADRQPPWLCYIRGCGKQLIRKGHMVDHIRMHLDERVHVCEHCPQTFLRKADCKRHLSAHNPEKAFQCNLCIKSFGRKDLLTRHRRKCGLNISQGQGGLGGAKEKCLKRKGIQDISTLNIQDSQGAPFVIGNMLSVPLEEFKRNGSIASESDGANKENIPPSSSPGGSMFSHGSVSSDGEGRRRKKASTHF